jgi:ABC-type transporter Mla subunit MlaD
MLLVVVAVAFLAIGIFIGPIVRVAIAKEASSLKAEYDSKVTAIYADAAGQVAAARDQLTSALQGAADVKDDLMRQLDVAHADIATLSAKVVSLVPAAPALATFTAPVAEERSFIGQPAQPLPPGVAPLV